MQAGPRGHPRVGGETFDQQVRGITQGGPSPRGRGNRAWRYHPPGQAGAIPAWAGKPTFAAPGQAAIGGHPRVGGETETSATTGTTRQGPSPRGRGNLLVGAAGDAAQGAIPAWAGKPSRAVMGWHLGAGHPRVGGETWDRGMTTTTIGGPSPRGRGNPSGSFNSFRRMRAIPAWAGKPILVASPIRLLAGHPRVGGETSKH